MTDATNPKDLLGIKKAPLRFVPHALRILAAPAMALGAGKYGPYNWRSNAVKLSVYLEAIDRHLAAYADRQDTDPESGASHLSHVAACLAIIADAEGIGKLIDDRPAVTGPAADLLLAQDATPVGAALRAGQTAPLKVPLVEAARNDALDPALAIPDRPRRFIETGPETKGPGR